MNKNGLFMLEKWRNIIFVLAEFVKMVALIPVCGCKVLALTKDKVAFSFSCLKPGFCVVFGECHSEFVTNDSLNYILWDSPEYPLPSPLN